MKNLLRLMTLLLLTGSASAQTTTQSFSLRAGWNAIWLELEPSDASCTAVFGNLPISSVWTYIPKVSSVEFIQQQSEALFNQPGWLGYLPPSRPDSFLSTLQSVHALRPYLINCSNAITLNITGVPVIRPTKWTSDSFNLRGFPVNPTNLPSFATFFGSSPAHSGQPIYQLQADGEWHLIPASTPIHRGESYWTFCQGASTYEGPTGITLEIGTGLNYGTALNEMKPRVINGSTSSRHVCWREIVNGANNPLSYITFTSNRLTWVNLPAEYCFDVAPGEQIDLRLAIRRKDMPGTSYGSLIEIIDDLGTRYLVPVTAEKLLPARTSLTATPGIGNPQAGLWVGTVTVSNVNEANSAVPFTVTPTRSGFDLRLILHVDGNGQTRLLKEVIQMWQNGTTTVNSSGRVVADRPGRYVLLTDDSLIPIYRGASLRDGVPVGRRISSVDFDFEGGSTNALPMTGAFGIGNTLQCTIYLDPNFATNPFKHRYHPDHDNLDATYSKYKQEAYPITRNIQLLFSPTDPAGADTTSSLNYGYNLIGGSYHETITGLHRTNLVAQGSFRLTRVVNSPVLNQ